MTNEEIKKIYQNFKEESAKLASYETILNQMYDFDPDNTDLICEIDKCKSNYSKNIENYVKSVKDDIKKEYYDRVVGKTFMKADKISNRLHFQIVIVNDIADVSWNNDIFHKYQYAPLFRTKGMYLGVVFNTSNKKIISIDFDTEYDHYSRKPAYLDSTSVLEENTNGWKIIPSEKNMFSKVMGLILHPELNVSVINDIKNIINQEKEDVV